VTRAAAGRRGGGAAEQGSAGAGTLGDGEGRTHPNPLPQRGEGDQWRSGEAARPAPAEPAPSPAWRERAGGEGSSSAPLLLRSRAPLLLFRLASWLAARAPLPAGYWLAALAGDLYFWLNPGHSRHAVANMAVALAQHPATPAVRRMARRSFRYYAMYLLDFLRLPSLPPAWGERGILGGGWEHLDAALARGRGVIVVTFHFGSWDRAAAAFSARGYRANALVDTFRPPALDAAIQQARAAHGLTLIPAESGAALRQVYAGLRRNEIVMLLIDRPQRDQGTPVTLFGRRTWLPSGPAALALRTGAAVLFGYLLRRPDLLSYQGGFEPVDVPSTGDRRADEQALMQALADRMERLIQQHPEQWYMFRPMWPDEPGPAG
jgi:lauroyl/myristoyl acyltransferase